MLYRYTLIIGKPPFETTNIQTTYKKIKANDYEFPQNAQISEPLKSIIISILQLDPMKRPSINDLLQHPYICDCQIPKSMPQSTLACPPYKYFVPQITKGISPISTPIKEDNKENAIKLKAKASIANININESKINSIKDLFRLFYYVNVDRFVDYSSKYGIGIIFIQDMCLAMMFAAYALTIPLQLFKRQIRSKYIISQFTYHDKKLIASDTELCYQYSVNDYPSSLKKKVALLSKFKDALKINVSSGSNASGALVYVKKWIKTSQAYMFKLSNKIFQVMFTDGTQIVMFSKVSKLYYVNKMKAGVMYDLKVALDIKLPDLSKRIRYAKENLTHLFPKKNKSTL